MIDFYQSNEQLLNKHDCYLSLSLSLVCPIYNKELFRRTHTDIHVFFFAYEKKSVDSSQINLACRQLTRTYLRSVVRMRSATRITTR